MKLKHMHVRDMTPAALVGAMLLAFGAGFVLGSMLF